MKNESLKRGNGNRNSLGFMFSYDALIAVIVVLLVVSSAYFSLFKNSNDFFQKSAAKRVFEEALMLLEKQQYLNKSDSKLLENELKKSIPSNFEWKTKFSHYEYKKKAFILKEEKKIGNWSANVSEFEIVHGKRIFLKFSKTKISRYAIAEFWIWAKQTS